MQKEWFIIIDDKQEGPYNFWDLKRHLRLNPDTLIWKEGFKEWTPIRFVPELQEIFKDEPEAHPSHEEIKPKPPSSDLQSEREALTLSTDPPPFLFWLIITLLILGYMLFQIYR